MKIGKKGDIGTVLTIDTSADISGGNSYTVKVIKPSGAIETWTGSLSGTDYITYTTTSADDFDEIGVYEGYVIVGYAGGNSWTGSLFQFQIKDVDEK